MWEGLKEGTGTAGDEESDLDWLITNLTQQRQRLQHTDK